MPAKRSSIPAPATLHPLLTPPDLRRLEAALRGLYGVLGGTLDPKALALAWDALRGIFGEPGRPPEGVSVGGDGLPDEDGFRALIDRSAALTDVMKDQLPKLPVIMKTVRNNAVSLARDGEHGKRRATLRDATTDAKQLLQAILGNLAPPTGLPLLPPTTPHVNLHPMQRAALDGLEEGFRVLAFRVNAILAKVAPGIRLSADPMRSGDCIEHAMTLFRQALPWLRTVDFWPPEDHTVVPWSLGLLNGGDNPPCHVRLTPAIHCLEPYLTLMAERRLKWQPDEWQRLIVDPMLEYHRDMRRKIVAALSPDAAGAAPPPGPGAEILLADTLAALRQLARTELKGYRRVVLEAICEAGGELPLTDVKGLCDWQNPIDDAWNSLRKGLNKKITSLGCELITFDRKARLRLVTNKKKPKKQTVKRR